MSKILHLVDYLMPSMGYQEFILPKFNATNKDHKIYIIQEINFIQFQITIILGKNFLEKEVLLLKLKR